MAKNALFHKTIITNGHGSNIYYFPAQRRDDVINNLQSNTEKVEVESSKWLPVDIMIDSGGVSFVAGESLRFEKGDYGFEYLVNQFNPLYQRALEDLYGS